MSREEVQTMKKQKYTRPWLEIDETDLESIITTSGGMDVWDTGGDGGGDDDYLD